MQKNKPLADLDLTDFADSMKGKSFSDLLQELFPDQSLRDILGQKVEDAQEMVRDFHQQIGAEISNRPTLLRTDNAKCRQANELLEETLSKLRNLATDDDTLLSRLCLSFEETAEWLQSHINEDLVAAADAIGDRAYVLFGDAVAAGMPLHEIFDEIHQSNMSKAKSKNGHLGKASKSDGYRKPELELILSMASMNSDRIEEEQADDRS